MKFKLSKNSWLWNIISALALTAIACWLIPKMSGLEGTNFWVFVLFMMLGFMAHGFVEGYGHPQWVSWVVFFIVCFGPIFLLLHLGYTL